jgi:hypothetical protein
VLAVSALGFRSTSVGAATQLTLELQGKQLEDIKAAVTHGRHMGALGCQPHTESGTRSDCTSSTETKLRDLQQQLLANQQVVLLTSRVSRQTLFDN